MKREKIEVLAPVGAPDSLMAAIRSGADAIYIGAKQFSARRNAENFDLSELKSTIQYCHIAGVKVYMALNIMLKQTELQEAFKTASEAFSCGIDAFIVQDLGLANLLHRYLPAAQLHASTQMTVHSPSALHILKDLGFKRVVAAREMSENELRELCSEAQLLDMETEVFVHGALCMSVSGQCLLSSVLGARSGNRGLCAGPCRLPFASQSGTGYDLSLKDLSLLKHIDKLCNMGVTSLKIEGRMKRPEYVAAATAACRSAVDNGFIEDELYTSLQSVFSRSGFTDGYFIGHRGRDMFGIRTRDDVAASADTFSKLHELYRTERQRVEIDIECDILPEEPISIKAYDGKNTVAVTGEVPQAARSSALDEDAVKQCIEKLGNTPYLLKKIKINLADGLFVPISALNSLRRDVIEKLNKARCQTVSTETKNIEISSSNEVHGGKKIITRYVSHTQLPDNLDGVSAVILPCESDFSAISHSVVTSIAELPRYIINENKLLERLKFLRTQGVQVAYCSNLACIDIAKRAGLAVMGGIGLNIANSESIKVLQESKVSAVTLSAELSLKDIAKIGSAMPKGIFAYGRLPLMLTRNCPIKNGIDCTSCNKRGYLTDRMQKKFPIMCSQGYCEVLNSTPIFLADRLDEIKDIDYLLIYFTDETKEECSVITDKYINGGSAPNEFTRGLYYKKLI